MIRFAVVHRAKDGLALSASTDLDLGMELRESKRFAKLISRKARQFPVRSTMGVGAFRIFFTTESDCCFLLISEANFQPILAFNCLDEMKKEFLGKYTRGAVDKAIRPYSFIEFDSYIQKTKQRYNSTRTLYTRVSLGEIAEQLQNNPPYEVSEGDLVHGNSIVLNNKYTQLNVPSSVSTLKHRVKLTPLTVAGRVSLLLSSLCVIMNIVRLVPFVSQHSVDSKEENHWMLISACFFLSALVNVFQCFLLCYVSVNRRFFNILAALFSVLLLYYLSDLRNIVQITFHLVANIVVAFSIWKRTTLEKLPNYNV